MSLSLDDSSDATHWLALDERGVTLVEVKEFVQEIINDYGYTIVGGFELEEQEILIFQYNP